MLSLTTVTMRPDQAGRFLAILFGILLENLKSRFHPRFSSRFFPRFLAQQTLANFDFKGEFEILKTFKSFSCERLAQDLKQLLMQLPSEPFGEPSADFTKHVSAGLLKLIGQVAKVVFSLQNCLKLKNIFCCLFV